MVNSVVTARLVTQIQLVLHLTFITAWNHSSRTAEHTERLGRYLSNFT